MAVGEWGNMTQEEKIAFGQQIKKEEEQVSFRAMTWNVVRVPGHMCHRDATYLKQVEEVLLVFRSGSW